MVKCPTMLSKKDYYNKVWYQEECGLELDYRQGDQLAEWVCPTGEHMFTTGFLRAKGILK
jgi:hypothetical protein